MKSVSMGRGVFPCSLCVCDCFVSVGVVKLKCGCAYVQNPRGSEQLLDFENWRNELWIRYGLICITPQKLYLEE